MQKDVVCPNTTGCPYSAYTVVLSAHGKEHIIDNPGPEGPSYRRHRGGRSPTIRNRVVYLVIGQILSRACPAADHIDFAIYCRRTSRLTPINHAWSSAPAVGCGVVHLHGRVFDISGAVSTTNRVNQSIECDHREPTSWCGHGSQDSPNVRRRIVGIRFVRAESGRGASHNIDNAISDSSIGSAKLPWHRQGSLRGPRVRCRVVSLVYANINLVTANTSAYGVKLAAHYPRSKVQSGRRHWGLLRPGTGLREALNAEEKCYPDKGHEQRASAHSRCL